MVDNIVSVLREQVLKFEGAWHGMHDYGLWGTVPNRPSAPALVFKGTGWYVTDYARSGSKDGKGKSDAGGDAPSADATSGSSSSTETKATRGITHRTLRAFGNAATRRAPGAMSTSFGKAPM